MNLTAEKKYYSNHYTKITQKNLNNYDIHKQYFAYGKRYSIIPKIIPRIENKKKLVELGSGYGLTLKYMSEVHGFNESYGVDIAYDKNFLIESGDNLAFIEANLNNGLPFEDRSIDLLVAMMVIEHLFDPFFSFKEISRTLSSGGIAVINLPLVTSIKNRFRLLIGRLPITSVRYRDWLAMGEWDGNHLHYFSMSSIKDLLKINNLELIEVSPVGKNIAIKKLFTTLFCSEISFACKLIENQD